MASDGGEGTVQPWRAPLELTKWSKIRQEDMCVCAHVQGFALLFHVCNRFLHTQFLTISVFIV
jgi:hypothetical protein